MAKNTFEVRGLKFYTRTAQFGITHLCTFSISLRLPWSKYWVAYFKWQTEPEGVSDSLKGHIMQSGKSTLIASGAKSFPSFLIANADFPADVVGYESPGILAYERTKNSQKVGIQIVQWGTGGAAVPLKFNMAQAAPASSDEHLSLTGKIFLWNQANKQKQTMQSSPNAAPPPPHPFFTPFGS